MGCFLGCFGSSKDANRRKITQNASPRNPNLGNQYQPINHNFAANPKTLETPPPPTTPSEKQETLEAPPPPTTPVEKQETLGKPIVPESRVNTEEKLSSGSNKRVTFDSNVKQYEHISADKVPEITQESENEAQKDIDKNCEKTNKTPTISDAGSSLSTSLTSFPPNHRYQNYIETDDDCEDFDFDVVNDKNEFYEDEEERDLDDEEYYYDDSYARNFEELPAGSCSSMESKTYKSPTKSESPDKETKTQQRQRFNRGSRVLNHVENTTQWKDMKAKENLQPKPHEENFPIDSKRPTWDKPNISNHEIAVNASLSTWLDSSEKTPPKKATSIRLEPIASVASASSYGSNSVKSHKERPILGPLTMEELKDISSSSSPRSPARSQDENPLVDTVRVHGNNGTPIGDSSSVSSFKGIPNTTSKYREDKRVKWHSTPFETRLERALNKGAG